MSKIERVEAALSLEEVDRPPFSVWYHFGDQHLEGKAHAETEYNFFHHYNLDFLKVMNDYEYPRQEELYDIRTPEDWRKLQIVNPWDVKSFREQLICLRELDKRLNGEAYFIDTIFSPWTTARNICYKFFTQHMENNEEDFLYGLDVITTNLEKYVSASIEVGVDGIFLSVAGATKDYMSFERYLKFGLPFDLRILQRAKESKFNVLHIHGSNIYFNELLNYPVNVFSWADRDKTNPSLSDARRLTEKCLMGGIDHTSLKETYLQDVGHQIVSAINETNGKGLIIAPGCSIKPNTYESQIRNIHSVLEELAK